MTPDQLTGAGWQALLAMALPPFMQWLKGQPFFPFLNFKGGSLNRTVSWVTGALVGLGIGLHYDATLGSLTITGLTLASIMAAIQHGGLQVALQHYVYKVAIAPPLPGIQQAVERDAASVPPAVVSFVGEPLNGSALVFGVKTGDPTPIGDTVTDPRGKFKKVAQDVYEKVVA